MPILVPFSASAFRPGPAGPCSSSMAWASKPLRPAELAQLWCGLYTERHRKSCDSPAPTAILRTKPHARQPAQTIDFYPGCSGGDIGLSCCTGLAGTTPWSSLVGALLMPSLASFLVCLVSGLRSKAKGEPIRHWLRSVWGVSGHRADFSFTPAVGRLRRPTRFLPLAASHRSLVLVHGYLCNHRVWGQCRKGFGSRHTVLAVNLEPLFTSIDKYVMPIEVAVMELCQQTGATQVALVGHSMGGLAIRAWMRACGTDRVARVVTLGTPHAGTQIERRTRTANGKQMGWKSPWLAELAASETDTHRRVHPHCDHAARQYRFSPTSPSFPRGGGHDF